MRESDEAGRTAERATGQGIVREKETGGWLRLWNGTKKAAITHISFISYFSFGGMRISRAVVGRF